MPPSLLGGNSLPPSIEDWLPQGHLARFVVEIVERLDLRSLTELERAGDGTVGSG